jgi:hypothetical protein
MKTPAGPTICDCGTASLVPGRKLVHGSAAFCGCWRADRDVRQAVRMTMLAGGAGRIAARRHCRPNQLRHFSPASRPLRWGWAAMLRRAESGHQGGDYGTNALASVHALSFNAYPAPNHALSSRSPTAPERTWSA